MKQNNEGAEQLSEKSRKAASSTGPLAALRRFRNNLLDLFEARPFAALLGAAVGMVGMGLLFYFYPPALLLMFDIIPFAPAAALVNVAMGTLASLVFAALSAFVAFRVQHRDKDTSAHEEAMRGVSNPSVKTEEDEEEDDVVDLINAQLFETYKRAHADKEHKQDSAPLSQEQEDNEAVKNYLRTPVQHWQPPSANTPVFSKKTGNASSSSMAAQGRKTVGGQPRSKSESVEGAEISSSSSSASGGNIYVTGAVSTQERVVSYAEAVKEEGGNPRRPSDADSVASSNATMNKSRSGSVDSAGSVDSESNLRGLLEGDEPYSSESDTGDDAVRIRSGSL